MAKQKVTHGPTAAKHNPLMTVALCGEPRASLWAYGKNITCKRCIYITNTLTPKTDGETKE